MAYSPRLKEEYKSRVIATLTDEFGYSNIMQVPKLQKIVLSKGVGAAVADMSAYQGHASLAKGFGIPILWPCIVEGGIQVNQQGKR